MFPRRGFILLCFICYGYISPTGNRKIAFCFFYGYLSPTGNYYIMLFLCYGYLSSFDEAYGKSSINPFSRRECISIEKHYKRCCFPVGFGVSSVERGFILLCFLCYGYQSLGEIYYTSFFLTLLHKNRMANKSVQASIILFPGSHAIQFAQKERAKQPMLPCWVVLPQETYVLAVRCFFLFSRFNRCKVFIFCKIFQS